MKYCTWIPYLFCFFSSALMLAANQVQPKIPTRSVTMVGGGGHPKEAWKGFLTHAKESVRGEPVKILIHAGASQKPKVVIEDYKKELTALSNEIKIGIQFLEFDDSQGEEKLIKVLNEANGIVITGGDQLYLKHMALNPRVLEAYRSAHKRGTPYFVTSAGTAFVADFMILGGGRGYAHGLSFIPMTVTEQHADARNRQDRLKKALKAAPPGFVGISVYESTSIEFQWIGDVFRGTVIGPKPVEIIQWLPLSKAKRKGDEFLVTKVAPGGIVEWSPLSECLKFILNAR